MRNNFDKRDTEYVSEPEEDFKKYVILGISKLGKEIIDYASTPEEAEYLKSTFQESFGENWDIEWLLTSDLDIEEDQFIENKTYDTDSDIAYGEEEWKDETDLEESLNEMFKPIIMPALKDIKKQK